MVKTNNIYNGDCLELMQYIEDKSIDCIITDLPYGQTARNKWDIIIPLNDYIIFKDKKMYWKDFFLCAYKLGYDYDLTCKLWEEHKITGLWKQYERIIKDNGAIILFANGMFTADLMHSNHKLWRYNLIWQKTQPTGFLNAKKMPLRSHEDICIFYKNLPIYNPQKTTGHQRKVSKAEHKVNCKETTDYGSHGLSTYDSTERYPKSVWTFAKDIQKCAIHPTQKPLALIEELIKTYTNEGELVLDSCAGSMTTAIAAINTGRNYICMEKDENIFNAGKQRLEKYINDKQN